MTSNDTTTLIGTPFHSRVMQANKSGRWVTWNRYLLPEVFTEHGHDAEVMSIREAAGLEDKSPLIMYFVSGPDATRFANRLVPRDTSKMEVDQAYYTPLCDERGKIIIEGLLFRLDETMYCYTSGTLDLWFEEQRQGLDVNIDNVTEQYGILTLQGPRSYDVLVAATGQDWSDLKFSRGRKAVIGNVEVRVWRQGFTGERGYEFWVPAEDAGEVWDAIAEAGEPHGLSFVGHHTQDVVRVEAGLVLPAIDYAQAGPDGKQTAHAYGIQDPEFQASPFELGIGHFVDFNKDDFAGKQALLEEKENGGPPRRLVGLTIDWADIVAMQEGQGLPPMITRLVRRFPLAPIFAEKRKVGDASSITWSPTLNTMIAFGRLEKEFSETGTRVSLEWQVGDEIGQLGATVGKLPFFDLKRKA